MGVGLHISHISNRCKSRLSQVNGEPRMHWGHNGAATPFMLGSFIPYSMPVYPGSFYTSPCFPQIYFMLNYLTI